MEYFLQYLVSLLIREHKINDALKLVELDPIDKRKYRKHSLGMKRRLYISQAIMERVDILILDEPTKVLNEQSVKKLIVFFN
ncbi:ATP-binding cassette domain-containing protein [Bacillus bombysepticus]|uniref:ATP-binding cassette domain-containing protein n=1 Tax=Bacillus cereus group TaxID=86661 RepID=UPI0015941F78